MWHLRTEIAPFDDQRFWFTPERFKMVFWDFLLYEKRSIMVHSFLFAGPLVASFMSRVICYPLNVVRQRDTCQGKEKLNMATFSLLPLVMKAKVHRLTKLLVRLIDDFPHEIVITCALYDEMRSIKTMLSTKNKTCCIKHQPGQSAQPEKK